MPWRQFENILETGPGRNLKAGGRVQGIEIRTLLDQAGIENGLNFGSKNQPAIFKVIIQRLDPQAVAGREQLSLAEIVDRESEHAIQLLQAVFSPQLIGVEQYLSVAGRAQLHALCLQLKGDFLVVVNFSIEDDPQVALLIRHRLMARG